MKRFIWECLWMSLAVWVGLMIGLNSQSAEAGKQRGETSTYTRHQGFRARHFYVASGDGVNQIEFICRAFPGVTAGSSTANAVWQVQRFTYDTSDRLSTSLFAGEDDAFNQVCDNRSALSYS